MTRVQLVAALSHDLGEAAASGNSIDKDNGRVETEKYTTVEHHGAYVVFHLFISKAHLNETFLFFLFEAHLVQRI